MPDGAPRKKIAIVGFTSSLHDAPWGDPEWDIIPCNNLHKTIPAELTAQATGWVNLHRWGESHPGAAGPLGRRVHEDHSNHIRWW